MTLADFRQHVDNLRPYTGQKSPKTKGLVSPHKPLLLLIAIRRAAEGRERLFSFSDIEQELDGLLKRFGTTAGKQHPAYPFVRLGRQPALWDLEDRSLLDTGGDPSPAVLREPGHRAGLSTAAHALMVGDPKVAEAASTYVIRRWFSPGQRVEVSEAVGLSRLILAD